MSNVIDYAVAYTNTSDSTTYLSGTFSVDVDTFTVTEVDITITNGIDSFSFGISDAYLWTNGRDSFQLQLDAGDYMYGSSANAYVMYDDLSPYGNPTIDFSGGASTFDYTDRDNGIYFGQYGNEGSVVQGSIIPTPCFISGTLISTPSGSIAVQDLNIGDLILNFAGQAVPVKWIGIQRCLQGFAGGKLPICISVGALGNGLPLRDLYVSPRHAMYVDNCLLIEAQALVNGMSITQATQWPGELHYFHIETEHHEIILAEGAPTETFVDNVSRACFNNYSEYQTLYPKAREMIELDIPRVRHQRQLPSLVKRRLEAVVLALLGQEKLQIVA